MSSIISETFADGADKALVLANEEWLRELSIGSNWNRLRLGMLFNIENAATSNVTAGLKMGFSNGGLLGSGVASGQLCAGIKWPKGTTNSLAGAAWTYTAASGNPYFLSPGDWWGLSNVNGTIATFNGCTTSGTSGDFILATNNGSTARRFPVFVEIKRDGADLRISSRYIYVTNTNKDYTLANFRTTMADPTDFDSANTVACGGQTLNGHVGGAIQNCILSGYTTHVASYGELTHAFINWDVAVSRLLRIFCVEVYRHA